MVSQKFWRLACLFLAVGHLAIAGDGLPVMKVLGPMSAASDINDHGQIVGCSLGEEHAVLWEDGVMTDLHAFGISSCALAINEQGDVVGMYDDGVTDCGGNGTYRASVWQDGVMIDLGTLGGSCAQAYDINDAGQVVGFSETNAGTLLDFMWERGVMAQLSTGCGAVGINNRGQAVSSLFLLKPNGERTPLGSLGGPLWRTRAEDINDRGQVVGSSETSTGETHAFVWEAGVMTDLGTLGGADSHAEAVNDRGLVVGRSETVTGEIHAFIWKDGVMTDLGALGGCTYSRALGINNPGQVVGLCDSSAVVWER